MHSYSVRLVVNQQRLKEIVPLYLRVIINGKVMVINQGLHWPLKFIDQNAGRIYPRSANDPDHSDYEMILQAEMGKVNDIFKTYRLRGIVLTPEKFKRECKSFNHKEDFIPFMKREIDERFKNGDIQLQTKKNHLSSYKRLVEYIGILPFADIDSKFLTKYVNWLKVEHGNDMDTTWCRVRDIKTYLAIAASEGIGINHDYRKYKNREGGGRIVYLEDSQIKALIGLKNDSRLTSIHTAVLNAFLFSCFASLRISDIRNAHWGWVNMRNEMVYIPWKNKKFGRPVTVPLTEIAKSFIMKQKGSFFDLPTDQEMNRSLKDLASWAEIDIHLTFHVARHTFATQFYRKTQNIVSLKEILGHSKIETTLVYAHLSDQDKRNGMDLFQKGMMDFLSSDKEKTAPDLSGTA